MIYKYTVEFAGDNFFPEDILKSIQGDFIVLDGYFKPTDKIPREISKEYGFGIISFWHPCKFSTEDEIIKYEKDIIDFIGKNFSLLVDNGVTDLSIFMEIYSDGGQCNFEIFTKELLKHLAQYGVSLPISFYVLDSEKVKDWENEIKLVWNSK